MLVRVPVDHHADYEQQAAEMGIPLGSWVTLQLAELRGLAVPDYIYEEIEAARERRRINESRQELPIPRIA